VVQTLQSPSLFNMRSFTAAILVLMACAVYAQMDEAISFPPPPAMEEEQAAFVEADAEAAGNWDNASELENWEGRSRNSALILKSANGNGGGGKKGDTSNKKGLTAFDAFDWKKIPTDKQLPGDVVRLRHAPGAVPPLNEEALPKNLLPPAGCSDPNQTNDVKLWNTLTTKLKHAKTTGIKYQKWLKAADLAFKKVKAQIKLTKKNFGLIQKAIKGMTHQRRQIVKRLKAAKLKRDLEVAQKKMKELNAYGKILGRTKSSLAEGFSSMNKRVKVLKTGMKSLQKFGEDA